MGRGADVAGKPKYQRTFRRASATILGFAMATITVDAAVAWAWDLQTEVGIANLILAACLDLLSFSLGAVLGSRATRWTHRWREVAVGAVAALLVQAASGFLVAGMTLLGDLGALRDVWYGVAHLALPAIFGFLALRWLTGSDVSEVRAVS